MINAMQSAVAGMNASETQLDTTAARIANYPLAVPPANSGDIVDLSTDMVNLLQARNNFAADTKVAQVADEIQQSTISMLASWNRSRSGSSRWMRFGAPPWR